VPVGISMKKPGADSPLADYEAERLLKLAKK
jgi:hypothetical protein